MPAKNHKCKLYFKIVALLLFCILNIYLFLASRGISYQYELAREHTRFREEMPTMDSWINSPIGKLKSYLYNVTNAEAFQNGTDKRMKLQQVGPIVYKIHGNIEVLHRNATSITFKKNRYKRVEFSPEDSVSPDILNQTITLPNIVYLGSAAQFNEWNSYVKVIFNTLTFGEKQFLTNSIYYFLWEFTTPGLKTLGEVVPFISSNCGMLYNALASKNEVFTVNIGTEHGMENFFRIQTLNDQPIFAKQKNRRMEMLDDANNECPIQVQGAFDNSLFPPLLQKDTPISIAAMESCRSLRMRYQYEQVYDGFQGYRYTLLDKGEPPSCLSSTYGIRLPKGMFDGSKCMINDAPTAFSGPQFYGSNYNWREHFEGLNPNKEDHEPYIILEPTTGIPVMEKYRFQSNIPMPDMTEFSDRLAKFSNMILPTFWYEFDMDKLPGIVKFFMRFNIYVTPVLQPILMTLMLLGACWSACKVILLLCGRTCADVYRGTSNVLLETTFPQNSRRDVTQAPFAAAVK